MRFNMIDLSIIITYYNKENIFKLIEFFSNFQYENIEVIIIDDHSDIPLETENISYIRNNKNMGIGYVRQQALELAKGKYITFVDADDMVMDNYILEILSRIESEADIYEFCYYLDSYDNVITTDVVVWNKVYKLNFITTSGCRFKPIRIHEDIEFNSDLLKYNPRIELINKPLYYHYDNEDGISKMGR